VDDDYRNNRANSCPSKTIEKGLFSNQASNSLDQHRVDGKGSQLLVPSHFALWKITQVHRSAVPSFRGQKSPIPTCSIEESKFFLILQKGWKVLRIRNPHFLVGMAMDWALSRSSDASILASLAGCFFGFFKIYKSGKSFVSKTLVKALEKFQCGFRELFFIRINKTKPCVNLQKMNLKSDRLGGKVPFSSSHQKVGFKIRKGFS